MVDIDVDGVDQLVSTGHLPGWNEVESLVDAAYQRSSQIQDGSVADYIPVLAQADPDLFGLCVAEVIDRILAPAIACPAALAYSTMPARCVMASVRMTYPFGIE